MHFNTHFNLVGKHAYLSASKYHWIRYDDEKFDRTFMNALAAQRGTELHDLARDLIRLGVKLPRSPKTLNMYVNDAIGFGMVPEQVLYYSDDCFGTADTIDFNLRRKFLRIHDLKTGVNTCSMDQLMIYAALFCLEYGFKPHEIETELRIYQNDMVETHTPDPHEVVLIMNQAVRLDKRIKEMRAEALS